MTKPQKLRVLWKAGGDWLVLALLATSLAANVVMGVRRALPPPHTFVAGRQMARISAEDANGRRATITWAGGDRPVLLYVFSPACAWCRRNLGNLKALSSQANARYRLVGLSTTTTGLADYVRDNDLKFPIYSNGKTGGHDFAVDETPEAALVSADGTIKEAWAGAYSGALQGYVEAKLGVHLPGLIFAKKTPPHL